MDKGATRRPAGGFLVLVASLLVAALVAVPTGVAGARTSSATGVFGVVRGILLYNDSTYRNLSTVPAEPSNPFQVVWDEANTRLLVTSETGIFVTIDPFTHTIVTSTDLGTELTGVAIDPTSNRAFVAEPAVNSTVVLNASSGAVLARLAVGAEPWGVAYDPVNGQVYVANSGGTNVTVINATLDRVVGSLHVGAQPYFLAVAPSLGRLFAADWGGNCTTSSSPVCRLTETNIRNGATVANLTLPRVRAMAYDTGNGELYAPEPSNGSVSVVDARTGVVVATVRTGPVNGGEYPASLAVDPSNGRVYVANEFASNFTVINAHTNQMVQSTPRTFINNVNSLVYVGGTNLLYGTSVVQESESVLGFVPSTLNVALTLPLIAEPWGLTYDPVNGRIYVQDAELCTLYALNGRTGNLIAQYPSGGACGGVYPTVDTTNGNVFAWNSAGLVVVNATTGREHALASKGNPARLAYDPRTGDLFAADSFPSGVSEIDPASNSVLHVWSFRGWHVGDVAYDSTNGWLYAPMWSGSSGAYSDKVLVINGTSGSLVGNLSLPASVGNQTISALVDAARGTLFIGNYDDGSSSGNILAVQLATGALVGIVPLSVELVYQLALDPRNGYVYGAIWDSSVGTSAIVKVDPATYTTVGTARESPQSYPGGLTIDTATGQIWGTVELPGLVVLLHP